MKQKAVMKVQMADAKKRSKAMKTVVGVPGVVSVAIEGADKNQIVVTGEGIDCFLLMTLLRKSMGSAYLVSFAAVTESKEKEKEKETEKKQQEVKVYPLPWPDQPSLQPPPNYVHYTPDRYQGPCCIM